MACRHVSQLSAQSCTLWSEASGKSNISKLRIKLKINRCFYHLALPSIRVTVAFRSIQYTQTSINRCLAHLQCPNAIQRTAFVDAISAGVIEWHDGPMNMYYEIMDPLMLQMSLNVSRRLDVMFNKKREARVVSQRDVPGKGHILLLRIGP